MLILALQYDSGGLIGRPPDFDQEPAQYPEIKSLMAHVCDALQETGAAHFRVFAFDDQPWPVDVRYDLLVVLEQIPGILAALRASAPEFTISFYEQGIERDLIFHRDSSNWLTVEYNTQLEWNPPRLVEHIEAADLERQLLALASDFVRAAQIVCPAAAASQPFRQWVDELHVPGPAT